MPAIEAEFCLTSRLDVGGIEYSVPHDAWSNFDYGYQLARLTWRFDEPYINCPSYQGVGGFVANYFGETFGQATPADDIFRRRGASFYRIFGEDWTSADFADYFGQVVAQVHSQVGARDTSSPVPVTRDPLAGRLR